MTCTGTDAALAAHYRSGLGIREIATKTGLSTWKVRQALLRAKVVFRGSRGRKPSREAIVESYRETRSCAQTAAALGVHRDTVEKYARAEGILRARGGVRKYEFNEAFFGSYTAASCYWAGFMAADGALVLSKGAHRIQFMLAELDRDHLDAFKRCCGSTHPVKDVETGTPEVFLCISSKTWWNDLHEKFNLTPRKSFTLRPPPAEIPAPLLWHYVRGFFDGDGGASNAPRQIDFTCGSRPFLEWLRAFLESSHKIGPNARVWRLCISGPTLRRIVPLMYAGSTPDMRLERKYEKMKEVLSG